MKKKNEDTAIHILDKQCYDKRMVLADLFVFAINGILRRLIRVYTVCSGVSDRIDTIITLWHYYTFIESDRRMNEIDVLWIKTIKLYVHTRAL